MRFARNAGGGSIWRDTYDGRYFLVWNSLGRAQHKHDSIIAWHIGQGAPDVFPLTNLRDSTAIRWQVGCIIVYPALASMLVVLTARQRPPGNTLAPPEMIDA